MPAGSWRIEGSNSWGDIAARSLLEVSGETAYSEQARAHARLLAYSESSAPLSPPEVIARLSVQDAAECSGVKREPALILVTLRDFNQY